jgi:hypothetical protein
MTEIATAPKIAVAKETSFIEWGPVFAGGLLASAVSFVMLTFGTTIGRHPPALDRHHSADGLG